VLQHVGPRLRPGRQVPTRRSSSRIPLNTVIRR
jgi:hypothetical protein